MIRTIRAVALIAIAFPAHAQDAEVSKLRERVEALEKKQAGESAFNPGISLILQGTAARLSRDPETYQITGFAPSGGEVGPPRRGFSLAESELVFSGNVDPYFRGHLAAALTPENEVEVEEAFIQTLALGRGFTVKGGRFLSGIGYQNEIHQHAWDFQDAALPYKAFLGGRLGDDGVQLRWLAPTLLFLELGTELGRGKSFPASDPNKNGAGAWSLFGHIGGDLGAAAWRAGLSQLHTNPRERAFEDNDSLGNPALQSITGSSRLWIADFVVKWPDFKLQGEFMQRRERGTLTYDDTAQAVPQFNAVFTGDYSSRQSGWYLQGVYRLLREWRAGYRYDRLGYGRVENGIVASGAGPTAADFPLLATRHNPTRNTLMVDWSPTEFSRFRLQFALDKARAGVTDNQFVLQYIHSLGAHGAHSF